MEQFSITIEPSLVKEIDRLIKEMRLYSSRNEFVRESIRTHLIEVRTAMARKVFENWAAGLKEKKLKPRLAREKNFR